VISTNNGGLPTKPQKDERNVFEPGISSLQAQGSVEPYIRSVCEICERKRSTESENCVLKSAMHLTGNEGGVRKGEKTRLEKIRDQNYSGKHGGNNNGGGLAKAQGVGKEQP